MTKKKKKTLQEFRDNNISNHCLGKKEKDYREKKKKRKKKANFVIPAEKINRYAISWSIEQKPTAKCCNATITKSAQY